MATNIPVDNTWHRIAYVQMASYTKLSVNVRCTKQDVTNNRSYVECLLNIDTTRNYSADRTTAGMTGCQSIAWGYTSHAINTAFTLTSGGFWVDHKADGTSGNVDIRAWVNQTWGGSADVTTQINLKTIPRTSQATLTGSPCEVNGTNALVISTNRASTSFKHKIEYFFGNSSGTLATDVTDSYTWVVPKSLLNEMSNVSSKDGRIKVTTTGIGSTEIGFTLTYKVKPKISNVVITELSDRVQKLGDVTVRGISQKRVTANVTAAAESPNVSVVLRNGNVSVPMSMDGTGKYVGVIGGGDQKLVTGVYVVEATDQRGNKELYTVTQVLQEYVEQYSTKSIGTIQVLDEKFNPVAVVDEYESFIWTDRYNVCGDFELYLPYGHEVVPYLKPDYYLQLIGSTHTMIIETLEVTTDTEKGAHLRVVGRSLESILDRRIVWKQKRYQGKFQDAIKDLITNAFISPENANRKVPNFVFNDTADETILGTSVDVQFTGDNLYEIITGLCKTYGFGFKIELTYDGLFYFQLYNGTDHTTKVSSYVEFSPSMDNLLNSDYIHSQKTLKTVALVGGEGEGTDRKFKETVVDASTGLNRRELFVDARNQSSKSTDNEGKDKQLTDAEYMSVLEQVGKEKLNENKVTDSFAGEADVSYTYVYHQDFEIGDVVQLVNEYGRTAKGRVTEFTTSVSDSNGYRTYPTFESVE